jgi:ABC-type sugar transport system ATPase subunit
MSIIEVSNLSKTFDVNGTNHVVLNDLNFKAEQGEFLVVVGASGVGKSTLLRIISGLDKQDTGDIIFDDEVVNQLPANQRNVGMVFQSFALYPHLNAYENIAFGCRYKKGFASNEKKKNLIKDIAETLDLSDVLEHYPSQLSGGQQQRVAIGRAWIAEPSVMLFDEPLSSLDVSLRNKLRLQIETFHRRYQSTTIYITHDQKEAMTLADRIVVLHKGKVEQVGTPEALYNEPKTKYVAGFLGEPSMNFFDVTIDYGCKSLIDVKLNQYKLSTTIPVNKPMMERCDWHKVTLGIRPEHIVIDESGSMKGSIEKIEYFGAYSIVHIKLEQSDEVVRAKEDTGQILSIGADVSLLLPPERIHLFNNNGISLRQ